jgi:hypothetical protein
MSFFRKIFNPKEVEQQVMTSEKKFYQGNEGLTLLEVLLAVGASFVIMVGGVFLFRNVLSGNDVNNTIRDVSLLQSNVRQMYSQAASYGKNGNITDALRKAGSIPSSMVDSSNSIYNRFGGDVKVTTNGNTFDVELTGIPTEACVKMVTSTEASSWKAVKANGTTSSDKNKAGSNGLPPDPVSAANACSQLGKGQDGGNTITWTSY